MSKSKTETYYRLSGWAYFNEGDYWWQPMHDLDSLEEAMEVLAEEKADNTSGEYSKFKIERVDTKVVLTNSDARWAS